MAAQTGTIEKEPLFKVRKSKRVAESLKQAAADSRTGIRYGCECLKNGGVCSDQRCIYNLV